MSRKREQKPKNRERLPRPRAVIFSDEQKDADLAYCRGKEWQGEYVDEIENWEDYV